MSFEIEQKFWNDDPERVLRGLATLGGVVGETIAQEDVYLGHPARSFAETGEAFRVRRVGERNAITYKGPKLGGPAKTRRELELDFAPGANSLAKLLEIVEALGFRPVATIRKLRTPHHVNAGGRDVEVVLDRVEGLGDFVEVETLASDESDLANAQAVVLDVARDLGLAMPESRSYLRMTLEGARR